MFQQIELKTDEKVKQENHAIRLHGSGTLRIPFR
jgi:hypothetical protein